MEGEIGFLFRLPFDDLFSMSGSQEGGTSNFESSAAGTARAGTAAHIDEA